MTFLISLVGLICWTSCGAVVAQEPVASANSEELPSVTRMSWAVRDALRAQALADTPAKRASASIELCRLYVLNRRDPRFGSSPTIDQNATKLRSRLVSFVAKQRRQLKRNRVERPSNLDSIIRQQIADAMQETKMGEEIADGAQGGAALGQGWQLVELIQHIIAPEFWDGRGGPGSIHYFANRRVLVVRATSDVHEQVKDLLIALR